MTALGSFADMTHWTHNIGFATAGEHCVASRRRSGPKMRRMRPPTKAPPNKKELGPMGPNIGAPLKGLGPFSSEKT